MVEGKAFIGESPPRDRSGLDDAASTSSSIAASDDGGGDDDGGGGGGGARRAAAAASTSRSREMFVLHIHFRKQRFVSRPVPCDEEPMFNETFPLELPKDFRYVDVDVDMDVDVDVDVVQ